MKKQSRRRWSRDRRDFERMAAKGGVARLTSEAEYHNKLWNISHLLTDADRAFLASARAHVWTDRGAAPDGREEWDAACAVLRLRIFGE